MVTSCPPTALFHVTIRPDAAFQGASASLSSRGIDGSPSAASAKKLLNCAVVIREDRCDKEEDDDNDHGDPDNATTTMATPEKIKMGNDKLGESYVRNAILS